MYYKLTLGELKREIGHSFPFTRCMKKDQVNRRYYTMYKNRRYCTMYIKVLYDIKDNKTSSPKGNDHSPENKQVFSNSSQVS